MFKHILWFFTIAARDEAMAWIKANFEVFLDEALVLSKQYSFYTEVAIAEEQACQIAKLAKLEAQFLNEEL